MKKGFSVIEIVLAIAIAAIVSTGAIATILQTYLSNRLAEEYAQATLLSQEGIEAVRSLRNQSWGNLVSGTYGLSGGSGTWQFAGSTDNFGKYIRNVKVEPVQRIGNNIVASGGTVDPYTYKITSTVEWDFTPVRHNTVVQTTYLTYFEKPIRGSWANPTREAGLDITGNSAGLKIQVQGNYAYLITAATTNNFVVVNITNTTAPVVAATLSLSGPLSNLAVSGNYAYVSSTSNTAEVSIVDISNPTALSVVGTYNAPGNANGLGIYYDQGRVYLGRANGTDNEVLVVDVNSPNSPTLLGSYNSANNFNELYLNGTYLYAATSSNTQEVMVLNVTNPAAISLAGSLDVANNNDLLTIFGIGSYVYTGKTGGNFAVVGMANPTAPTLAGTYGTAASVNDVVVNPDADTAFLATGVTTSDFMAVNVVAKNSPVLLGSYNTSGILNGIAYSADLDRVFCASANNNEEFIILKPQ